ncbi:type II toxin-antitoxin system PemK/MazF family toxin [Congregicoccus parvus]|uniref:type II toxin-antitoxin system PemK/MazF family toxin n=1 Tax=Congregicoccus parvus TaxID=3081749 RepID=UPI003FA5642D
MRPALVLASFSRGDVLLCQITSQDAGHPEAIELSTHDFMSGGSLDRNSFVLPHRLVTAHESCIRRVVGSLSRPKLQEIRERVCAAVCSS